MKIKNILVTGASGLLGRPVLKALSAVDAWKVRGTAYRRSAANLIQVDLADLQRLPAFLDRVKPDTIIHSAAERRPDVSQRDPAGTQRLNVGATAAIAAWAAAHEAFMVYISTDYVFDGSNPPYRVDSPTHPLNSYGASKLAGEASVLAACHEYAILRVPILYGFAESLEESAVTGIAQNILDAREGERVIAENWAVRHPTLTDDVADVLKQMLLHRTAHPDFKGIFHWSGNEAMTKYAMARVFAHCLDFDADRIIPDNNPPAGAPRPQNSRLDTSVLTALGIGKHTPFRAAVPLILQEVLDRRVKSEG